MSIFKGLFGLVLVSLWIGFFIFMWLCWMDAPGEKSGTKRYHLFYKKFKRKPSRLCVGHMRISRTRTMLAIVDVNNCEMCERSKRK